MNLRSLSRPRRILLFVLAMGDLLVLGLMASAIFISLQGLSPAQPPAAASLPSPTLDPSATPTSTPSPTLPPTETPTPQPTNTRVVSREYYNRDTVDDVIEEVIFIRGLEPTSEVPFSMLKPKQADEKVASYFHESTEEVERQWTIYQTLGMLPEDIDFTEPLTEDASVDLLGFYAIEEEHIYIITERVNIDAEEESVFAHEYTHALQDQHFDLSSYQQGVTSLDGFLASEALVEGDATVVMTVYLYDNATQSDWDRMTEQAASAEQVELDEVSESLAKVIDFPYNEGAYFVMELLLESGWDGINRAFSDPPHTTEQVLHPEKYYGSRDRPQEVSLPTLPGEEWQKVMEETVGEFVISAHMGVFLTNPDLPAKAAAGWDGDRIGIWEDASARQLILWETVWDSSAEAAEFEDAYQAVIPTRFDGIIVTGDGWWEKPGASVGLLREYDHVWIVWGPDRATTEAALGAR